MINSGTLIEYPDGTQALYPDLNESFYRILSTREYVIHDGDTILSIANRELGKFSYWTDILILNPSLDMFDLIPGTTIKLPVYG